MIFSFFISVGKRSRFSFFFFFFLPLIQLLLHQLFNIFIPMLSCNYLETQETRRFTLTRTYQKRFSLDRDTSDCIALFHFTRSRAWLRHLLPVTVLRPLLLFSNFKVALNNGDDGVSLFSSFLSLPHFRWSGSPSKPSALTSSLVVFLLLQHERERIRTTRALARLVCFLSGERRRNMINWFVRSFREVQAESVISPCLTSRSFSRLGTWLLHCIIEQSQAGQHVRSRHTLSSGSSRGQSNRQIIDHSHVSHRQISGHVQGNCGRSSLSRIHRRRQDNQSRYPRHCRWDSRESLRDIRLLSGSFQAIWNFQPWDDYP